MSVERMNMSWAAAAAAGDKFLERRRHGYARDDEEDRS
jgi:hypothetical protein